MTRDIDLPPGYSLVRLEECASTNDEIRNLAREGAEEGLIVMAERQTAARGRRGRAWSSLPGNLCFSLLLRPECPIGEAAQIGFVAGLALVEASASLLPPHSDLSLKWPNDMLLFDAKVAGILLETENSDQADVPNFVILGIGVNLAASPEDTPYKATSFAESAEAGIAPEAMLAAFCRYFLRHVRTWVDDGFPPIRRQWLGFAKGLGQDITVDFGSSKISGIFGDLGEDGSLRLETPDGTRTVTAGDIHFGRGGG
jgi:BirA family biotin operon repressor/biotin-[acetyl-CoA-carboxylase] ligase